ncbi:TPA: hypothetical protein U0D20_004684 [Escherichia coli]|nr:hypothetical protein [Escherichia coli]
MSHDKPTETRRCCGGVVTQAYGQPDNPVSYLARLRPAILTAAPFRGLPQPEAHSRSKFNDKTPKEEVLAVRFRVVCLLFTTSGEVVSVIPNDRKMV